MSRDTASRAMMLAAVACALISTGLVVRRELFLPRPPRLTSEPVEVRDWEQYLVGGRVIGAPDAVVKVIEFTDYECPFCRHFALNVWPAVQDEYGDRVALVIRHWPLSQHENARAAAQAAECAGAQGCFERFHNLLFVKQDSIGIKPYTEFARESGIVDIGAFQRCASSRELVPSIESGIAGAKAIRATGTPTLIINGLKVSGAADSIRFKGYIERALKRKQ